MNRRALLLAALADGEFPAAVLAEGQRLVLNGTGRRLYSWLQVEVYRAALYLAEPARDPSLILAAATPKLVEIRYRRAVPREAVVAAWEESAGAPLPAEFLNWLRPIAAGEVERQLFLPQAVRLEGPVRPAQRVAGADFARRLLGCWIGPAAPTEELRRGLLGLSS